MSECDPFVVLDGCAASDAAFVVTMARDERDGFRLSARDVSPSSRRSPPPRSDLLPLLPAGSRWTDALAWHSHFGFPLVTQGRRLWAIGAVRVCARDGGGAYPEMRAYLHEAAPQRAWEALATALDAHPREANPSAADATVRFVAVTLPGQTVNDSLREQAAVVRHAIAAGAAGRSVWFRTVILSEPELAPLVRLRRRLPDGVDQCVVGVADALSRAFAPKTQLLLDLRRVRWRM